jgi:lysophospholipase L1-like esterase
MYNMMKWSFVLLNLLSLVSVSSSTAVKPKPYSKYLFLGDSLFMYWLCYHSTGEFAYSTFSPCVDYYIFDYFDNKTSSLLVDCPPGATSPYCESLFQHTFPGALNLAVPGSRVDQLTEKLLTDGSIQQLSSGNPSVNNVSQIIIESGTNSMRKFTVAEIEPMYDTLLKAVTKMFPYANVLMLGIFPANYTFYDEERIPLNKFLSETYSNNASFPNVRYVKCEPFFKEHGEKDHASYVADELHLNAIGYEHVTYCIKSTLFPAQHTKLKTSSTTSLRSVASKDKGFLLV